jgi:hypothetical protein
MNIKKIKDDYLFQEVIERLMNKVKQQTGMNINFGNLTINIHNGQCVSIDYSVKERCFKSSLLKLNGGKNG